MKVVNFQLEDYYTILQSLAKGEEVIVEQDSGLLRSSHFFYSNLFPSSIGEIANSRNLIKEIRKQRHLSPFLILPQRVVSFHHSSFKSKLSSSSYQLFLSETDDEEAYTLRSEKLKGFDDFDFSSFPYATLSTEYRVDWSRLLILLLRQLDHLGAKIEVAQDDATQLKENYKDALGSPIVVSGIAVPSPLYIRFEQSVIMIIPQEEDSVMVGIDGEWTKEMESSLRKFYGNLFDDNLISLLEQGKGKISLLPKHMLGVDFDLKKTMEQLQQITEPSLSICDNAPSIRELIAQCDRKYDMYKEVNSSRSLMKHYFYRYGNDTDEIAEIIYERMGSIDRSNLLKAWQEAERIFQERNEFKR